MPLFRRRPLLRAAAVGGGAYALGKRHARTEHESYGTSEQSAVASAPPTAPAAGGITSQDTERLAELGKLHESGVLTDQEFAQQKSRILGTG